MAMTMVLAVNQSREQCAVMTGVSNLQKSYPMSSSCMSPLATNVQHTAIALRSFRGLYDASLAISRPASFFLLLQK